MQKVQFVVKQLRSEIETVGNSTIQVFGADGHYSYVIRRGTHIIYSHRHTYTRFANARRAARRKATHANQLIHEPNGVDVPDSGKAPA